MVHDIPRAEWSGASPLDGSVALPDEFPNEFGAPWGDAASLVVSLLVHLILFLALGLVPLATAHRDRLLTMLDTLEDTALNDVAQLPDEFAFRNEANEEIGANSEDGTGAAFSLAPIVSDLSEVPKPVNMPLSPVGQIELREAVQVATGLHFDAAITVKGTAGYATTGATGAIDRITHEIVLSLEERKTLVVWLFDQSGSLARQRTEIRERLARVYEELGVIEAAGNPAFKKHADKPLLSAVVAFGEKISLLTKDPTDDVAAIQDAIAKIEQDNSGIERVFSAVWTTAQKFRQFRQPKSSSHDAERNVMFVVFSDEAGDDQEGLDKTVQLCRKLEIPVYVIGVPAPFGMRETLVKWVDPDPKYDQSPQWAEVSQGPESLRPECLKLRFEGGRDEEEPLDSGFGPFALTRLCYETGGIYFTVHPNRRVERAVSRGETSPFSAHLKRFFDPQVMLRYRPEYISAADYDLKLKQAKHRGALVEAAQRSWLTPLESPRTRFVKRSEAELAAALTEAQKDAAKLEPKLTHLYNILKQGEVDRDREPTPRWQAGYDLAMGRALASKVRAEAYNSMLAKMKRGIKFSEEKNNTWVLRPSKEIGVSSQLEKAGDRALMYLARVAKEHPGTPWAYMAERELKQPLGWKWAEESTDLSPPRTAVASNAAPPRPPPDDQKRSLPPPPPKRSPPRL